MIDRIKIGSFLRQLRKENALTQEELAEKFGVSSRSVSRWENGSTMPELEILVDLADFYHVDIKEIIDGERKREIMSEGTKEVLRSVANYAKQEKRLVVRRKCIATFVITAFFVLCIFLGTTLLPSYTKTSKLIIGRLSVVIALVGLSLLWIIVINENRKNGKKISKNSSL